MILITGSHGFIGSNLLKKIEGTCIDLKIGNDIFTHPVIEGVDTIYHLAAQTSVEDSWKDPFTDSLNFNMVVKLSRDYPNARIIFAQSAASLEMNSPYGFSKRIGGDYLKLFHKNYVICTFPNVYGGGKGVVDLFKGQDHVTIYGNGDAVRDFVHVDDIVEGLVKAQKWPIGEYFMGSGKGTRIYDLAKGKNIHFAPARKEISESILPNTTPDWSAKVDVMEYIK